MLSVSKPERAEHLMTCSGIIHAGSRKRYLLFARTNWMTSIMCFIELNEVQFEEINILPKAKRVSGVRCVQEIGAKIINFKEKNS